MNPIISGIRHYGFSRSVRFALAELKLRVYNQMVLGSYSQFEEDLFLDRLTGGKKTGFYVDIGAFDPVRFNNTLRFYRRGWRGINIEPDQHQWDKFISQRPDDINLNVGAGNSSGKLMYYAMDPTTMSTFSEIQVKKYIREGFYPVSKRKVPVMRLSEILSRYALHRTIDFVSIDVEGLEIDVLKGNDWKKFRPHVLCTESTKADKKNKNSYRTIVSYLHAKRYRLIRDNGLNTFYKDMQREKII